MDKKKMMNLALVLLPLIAVVLAGMPDAVTIYEMAEGDGAMSCVPVTCSFFTLIEDIPAGSALPFAALFGGLTFGLALVRVVTGKSIWCKFLWIAAFIGMTLSVLPVLVQETTMVMPNMLVPILLGVECLLAIRMQKLPEQKDTGARLDSH